MTETSDIKSSTRVVLLSAALMPIILLTGPMGYKLGIIDLQPSFASLMVAFVGGIIVAIAALVFWFRAGDLPRDKNLLIASIVLALVPPAVMTPTLAKAFSVPPIHDITTDTQNPPEFDVMVKRRVHAPNPLDYGSEELPAEELASLQQQAYPNVKPLFAERPVDEVISLAANVLEMEGLAVANVDAANGRVEATATTFWFGFKDDLVVRALPTEAGTRIDVRSVSRVGQSDLGANAARIESFLAAMQSALGG